MPARKKTPADLESALIEAYPSARALAIMLCRRPFEAEDLVQEAMMRAIRSPPASTAPGVIHAWLRTTMVRCHMKTVRRIVREAAAFARIAFEPPPRPPVTQASAEMLEALTVLGPKQRACIVLRYVHDLPDQEIADLLGIAPGTVKAHLSQALARLRSRLD